MKTYINENGFAVIFCPGCNEQHHINVSYPGHVQWKFNQDFEKPTFSPSVKITWPSGEERKANCCHFHIKAGRIEYCGDCTHSLRGQKLELSEISKPTE